MRVVHQVFLFALAIVNLIAVNHGYGEPSKSLHPADLQLALQVCLYSDTACLLQSSVVSQSPHVILTF